MVNTFFSPFPFYIKKRKIYVCYGDPQYVLFYFQRTPLSFTPDPPSSTPLKKDMSEHMRLKTWLTYTIEKFIILCLCIYVSMCKVFVVPPPSSSSGPLTHLHPTLSSVPSTETWNIELTDRSPVGETIVSVLTSSPSFRLIPVYYKTPDDPIGTLVQVIKLQTQTSTPLSKLNLQTKPLSNLVSIIHFWVRVSSKSPSLHLT